MQAIIDKGQGPTSKPRPTRVVPMPVGRVDTTLHRSNKPHVVIRAKSPKEQTQRLRRRLGGGGAPIPEKPSPAPRRFPSCAGSSLPTPGVALAPATGVSGCAKSQRPPPPPPRARRPPSFIHVLLPPPNPRKPHPPPFHTALCAFPSRPKQEATQQTRLASTAVVRP